MKGRFITFEGGEGAGKSTQIRLLADHLWAAGCSVIVTREPGGSPFAERVRQFLFERDKPEGSALAEALLFYAARADHLAVTIKPALDRGAWVLCDRFMDSTRAYQGAGGRLAGAVVDTLEALVVGDARPDLTIILDLDPLEGLQRAGHRQQREQPGLEARDPFEGRELAFHQRLRQGFLDIAAAEPARCAIVDAAAGVEDLAARIRTLVTARLGPL